ncbi:MAG: N-acetylmuramoyl-L-alanine amidase [Pseudomonadota bacterium]
MRVFWAIWIGCLWICPAIAHPNDAERSGAGAIIETIEVQEFRNGGELRLEFSGSLQANSFLLSDPDRLVIDFSAVVAGSDFNELAGIEAIISARFGLFQPDRPRLVLDLSGPFSVELRINEVTEGEGEVEITLRETTREQYDEIAGWPTGARWSLDNPPEMAAPGSDVLVAIDPGHGGFDPGATFEDLVEKEIVLDAARVIAERIDREDGFRSVLLRDQDVFVPLRGRIDLAHRARAHVMISLHADSITEGMADGISIYTLSTNASDKAAEDFAERENRVDILAGADLVGETDEVTHLLLELSRRGTDVESDKLARSFLSAFRGRLDLLGSRPYRRAGFYVLKAPDIPSVLLELGFLSSEADRIRLVDPKFFASVANAVVIGLHRWRVIADPAFIAPRN